MQIKVKTTPIPDLLEVHHEVFDDRRGFFLEAYRQDEFESHGLPGTFVQLNHSQSAGGVLRGLHFQWDPPMGKLVRVIRGTAFLVAVDVRSGSPTLGRWFGRQLSAEDPIQIWAPAGFARGFCALTDPVEIQYLCTGVYNSLAEGGIRWNDRRVAVDWPLAWPQLSPKDESLPTLVEWLASPEAKHFRYEGGESE